jgi:hypothetical protein
VWGGESWQIERNRAVNARTSELSTIAATPVIGNVAGILRKRRNMVAVCGIVTPNIVVVPAKKRKRKRTKRL